MLFTFVLATLEEEYGYQNPDINQLLINYYTTLGYYQKNDEDYEGYINSQNKIKEFYNESDNLDGDNLKKTIKCKKQLGYVLLE